MAVKVHVVIESNIIVSVAYPKCMSKSIIHNIKAMTTVSNRNSFHDPRNFRESRIETLVEIFPYHTGLQPKSSCSPKFLIP